MKKQTNECKDIKITIIFPRNNREKYCVKTSKDLLKYINDKIGRNYFLHHIFFKNKDIYNSSTNNIKVDRLTDGDIIELTIIPNLNPSELVNFIIDANEGVERISKFKPVATFTTTDYFDFLWSKYTIPEKEELKEKLSERLNLEIDIYFEDYKKKDRNQTLFYSTKYLPILAEVFEFTMAEAFRILTNFNQNIARMRKISENTMKEKDFINIAFGDKVGEGFNNGLPMTENGIVKLTLYITIVEKIKNNNKLSLKKSEFNNKIVNNKIEIIHYTKFADYIISLENSPGKIGKMKPVGTLNSSSQPTISTVNWIKYTPEEKEYIKYNLSEKLDTTIDIYEDYIFYSVEYLTLLSDLFDIDLRQGLKILGNNGHKQQIEMDFIKIAFGDVFGWNNNYVLSKNSQNKLKLYATIMLS